MDISIEEIKSYTQELSVLYVEDDLVSRDIGLEYLKPLFLKVDVASNGEEGLKHFLTHSYDLIITDIRMPKMDGLEMIKSIKKHNKIQSIIVTSSYNDPEYLIPLIDLGIGKFLLKPFSYEEFHLCMHEVGKYLSTLKKTESKPVEVVNDKIIDQIDNAIVVINKEGIIGANEKFIQITGFEDSNELKRNICDLAYIFQKSDGCMSQLTNQKLIEAFEQGNIKTYKVRILGENSSKLYVLKYSKAVSSEKYIVTLTDITDIQDELQKATCASSAELDRKTV